jgi:ubiquinone/menaquinone biosynthesis C-methylase UbiE
MPIYWRNQAMTNQFANFPNLSKDHLQAVYDELAPSYDRRLWVDQHLFGVKRLRQQLLKLATGDVLEVACGTGLNFPYFGPIASLTAVDLSPEMLAIAEQGAQKAGLEVTLQVMDAEALTFTNGRFDTVVSALSTCTFPDQIAALQEMSRVCKAGGRILLLEHGRSSLRPLAHYQNRQAQTHYEKAAGCRWNQEPTVLVKAAGLRLISVHRATFGIFYRIQAAPA